MKRLKLWWQVFRARRQQHLPCTTTPYRAELERVQRRYALLILLLVGAIGWYAYKYAQARHSAEQLVSVVVASTDLKAPHQLEASDLRTLEIPQQLQPAGTWTETKDLVGQTLLRSVVAQEILLPADVHPELDSKSISAKFTEAFAFSLGEDWLVAKLPNVRPGDMVDILASNPKGRLAETTPVAEGLKVLAVPSRSGRKSLVVNATQTEAQALLFARGLRLPMQVLVHSALPPEEILIEPNPEPNE